MATWLSKLLKGSTSRPDPQSNLPVPWPGFHVPHELWLDIPQQLQVSVVWAAIRIITDSVASGTWRAFDTSDGRAHRVDDGVAYMCNTRPNPEMTARSFWEAMLGQMLIYGNAYAEVVFDGAWRPAQLWPLESYRMRVTRDIGGTGELRYLYSQYQDALGILPPERILHFKGPSLNAYLGSSTLAEGAKSIALAAAEQKFASQYFANGTVLSGYLKVPGRVDPETAKALKREWTTLRPTKKWRAALLQNGADWIATQIDAQKALLVEAQSFAVEDVARFFGVPPAFLGSATHSQGYGKNISDLYLHLVRSLGPWAQRLVQEVQYKLFSVRAARVIELDLTHLTRGDAVQQATANEILIRSGQRTINECRNADNLNDTEGGDEPLVAQNLVPLDRLLNPPEPPEPPAPQPPALPPLEEQPAADPGESDVEQVSDLLKSHLRRVKARTADLRRAGKTDEQIARHLADLLDRAVADLQAIPRLQAKNGELRTAAESVLAGVEPAKAAQHLLNG